MSICFKRIILLFIVLLPIFKGLIAQEYEWAVGLDNWHIPTQGMITDDLGNLFVLGHYTDSADVDPGQGVVHLTSPEGGMFLLKLNNNGDFVWVKDWIGADTEGASLAIRNQQLSIIGSFTGTVDFDPNAGVSDLTSKGLSDMFVVRLDTSGNFVWSKAVGGTGDEFGYDLAYDNNGNMVTTMEANSPVLEAYTSTTSSIIFTNSDIRGVIVKYNTLGNIAWSKGLRAAVSISGSTYAEIESKITIDVMGDNSVVISGSFAGSLDFDPSSGLEVYVAGFFTARLFVLKLTAAGIFSWVKVTDPNVVAFGGDVAIDSDENIVIVGGFEGTNDFDPGPGVYNLSSLELQPGNPNQWPDNFIWKLDNSGTFVWARRYGSISLNPADIPLGLIVDDDNSIYICGHFTHYVDFDMNAGIDARVTDGANDYDAYVLKVSSDAELVWLRTAGEDGQDYSGCGTIAIDQDKNVFISGAFNRQLNFVGNSNSIYLNAVVGKSYIAKLNNDSCSSLLQFTIDSAANRLCNEYGFASTSIDSGTAPFTYQWNTTPPQMTDTISVDTSGIFTCTVTDSIGCMASKSVLIGGSWFPNDVNLAHCFYTPIFRPGRNSHLWFKVFNMGCVAQTGQIKLVLDPLLTFTSSTLPPDSIVGDTLIWNFVDLDNDSEKILSCMEVLVSDTAMLGDQVCLEMFLTPIAGDANPANNYRLECRDVVNSYDPNDKLAYPLGACQPHYLEKNQSIDYTIRFQNTGTAEAIDIFILDTLDHNLDINTLEILGSSHEPMITEVIDSNILKFRFDNIWLPDSSTSQLLSNGFVSFRIHPATGIPNGTYIENSGSIYFDFNVPVKTNTTWHTLVDSIPLTDTIVTTVDACTNYQFFDSVYTQSGVYYKTLDSYGCLDIRKLDLTITGGHDSTDVFLSGCDSVLFDNNWYDTSAVVYQSFSNTSSCDSIVKTAIEVFYDIDYGTDTVESCGSYMHQGSLIVGDTLILDTTSVMNGCDSITATQILIYYDEVNYNADVQDCDTTFLNGVWYFVSQQVVDTSFTLHGCYLFSVTDIFVNTSELTQLPILIGCDSLFLNGSWYYSDTSLIDSSQTSFGCDSLVVIDIIINHSVETILPEVQACDSALVNGIWYYIDTTDVQSLATVNGCDSIILTNIDISSSSYYLANSIEACDSIQFNGVWYNNSQIVLDTLGDIHGCDSVIETPIEIHNSYEETKAMVEFCDSAFVNGIWYFANDLNVQSYSNVHGCDSIIRTPIVIHQSTFETLPEVEACDSTEIDGLWYYQSQTITDILSTSNGCDSVVQFDLIISYSSLSMAEIVMDCDSVLLLGTWFYNDTLLLDTLITSNGCDSIINYTIEVNPSTTSSINDSILLGEIYTLPSGIEVNVSGIYIDTILNSLNCDSIIEITLFVDTMVGINDQNINDLDWIVFPNPASNSFEIRIFDITDSYTIEIQSALGQSILDFNTKEEITAINTKDWSKGIYFVLINNEFGQLIGMKKVLLME